MHKDRQNASRYYMAVLPRSGAKSLHRQIKSKRNNDIVNPNDKAVQQQPKQRLFAR